MPLSMVTLVAPSTCQRSVVLAPVATLEGVAANHWMVGAARAAVDARARAVASDRHRDDGDMGLLGQNVSGDAFAHPTVLGRERDILVRVDSPMMQARDLRVRQSVKRERAGSL